VQPEIRSEIGAHSDAEVCRIDAREQYVAAQLEARSRSPLLRSRGRRCAHERSDHHGRYQTGHASSPQPIDERVHTYLHRQALARERQTAAV
jgi:hypothetical protein